jgi:MYXO-CTERM domain-containing protein
MIDWIQDTIGAKRVREPSCNAPPVATAEPLVTHKGYTRSTTVVVTDEDGDAGQATLAIVVGPAHGKAAVEGMEVKYTPDDGYVGPDAVTVAVTDAGNAEWERTGDPVTVELVVPIEVRKTFLGLGCETAPGAGVGLLGAILLLARRRR